MSSNDDTQLVTTGDFLQSWRGAPTSSTGDVLIGATLNGTYVVERLLGEGGMGRVYLARHTRIAQKRVAVKVLHSEFSGNEQVLARFQREAEAAATISHPNVVSVLDIDVTKQGMPYLVCEYLEGVDLSDHLREVKRLDVPDALSIARQLCRGLAAAHARGVIHRDLKPPNIFLVGDFSKGAPPRLFAKIVDFGLSRFHGGEQQNLTKTGVIMGTPSYMAPEQARGQTVDQRVDVYGLGTILYTVLTGRPPYEEESAPATILALLNSEPPRPRSLVPTIPAHIEVVIERAMAKKSADRYPDMAAFEAALDALPGGRTTTSVQPAALAPAPPSAARIQAASGTAADVQAARPRLLLSLAAAASLSMVSALVALSGVELATGYRFDRVELLLILLAIAGTSLTPAILWFLHIRRRIWDNSSRVLSLLVRVRASVLAGAVSYALLVLTFQLIDGFLSRVVPLSLAPLQPGWPGWSLLLPAAAFVIAISTAWRRQLLSARDPGWQRFALLSLLAGVTGLIALAIVYGGVLWRAASVVPVP